jgi:5-methyltetrahydropteroyltriglutamate--homocysteine methyltransferase
MLPTEQVGSIPRPTALIQGIQDFEARRISQAQLNELYLAAVQETISALGSHRFAVITDGEQAKHSFATYPSTLHILAPDGMPISFVDGHIRNFPRIYRQRRMRVPGATFQFTMQPCSWQE